MKLIVSYETDKRYALWISETLKNYFKKLKRWIDGKAVETFTISEKSVRCVKMQSYYTNIEIQKAFNQNLVIQNYRSHEKKIVVFLPLMWQGKIYINSIHGDISCNGVSMGEQFKIYTKYGKLKIV